MLRNGTTARAVLLALIAILLPARAQPSRPDCDWSILQEHDTLTLLFRNRPMGTLTCDVVYTPTRGVVERTRMVVEPTALVTGMQRMVVDEVRRYDATGRFHGAEQRLESVNGVSEWVLEVTAADSGKLRMKTGGIESVKTFRGISENLHTTRAIRCGIARSTIAVGDAWSDTSFDLTSARSTTVRTVCKDVPRAENGWKWAFVNTSDVSQRDERWEVDTAGRTVYQEIQPYFSAVSRLWRDTSRAAQSSGPVDLLESVRVPASRRATQGELIALVLDSGAALHPTVRWMYRERGGRWVLNPPAATCAPSRVKTLPDSLRQWTVATPILQSGDPRITSLAQKLRRRSRDVCAVIETMNRHVYTTLEKRPTSTFSSAVETLKAGYGDCGEHAVLLGALLRASGIPARIVYGLVYIEGKGGYYYHAWVMAWAGEWVFVDPSHGVFPAPRDRVPLIVDDSGENILDLNRLVGRIRIEHVPAD